MTIEIEGTTVVLTGALSGMTRKRATARLEAIKGNVLSSVEDENNLIWIGVPIDEISGYRGLRGAFFRPSTHGEHERDGQHELHGCGRDKAPREHRGQLECAR